MLYWIIAALWCVLGTAIFWIIFSAKWAEMACDIAERVKASTMTHGTPGYRNYADLKFSILRHAVFFLLVASLMYIWPNKILCWIVTTFQLWYSLLPILRYNSRRKILAELDAAGVEDADFLKKPISDSFLCVIHAALCVVFTYVLYWIRP